MSNNVTEQETSLEEIMENADLAAGLDLDMQIGQDEEVEVASTVVLETGKARTPGGGGHPNPPVHHHCKVPSMKINCDLEVAIGSKNKIIYVCPGKVQYFTASAICCSGDETIEIEYIGRNKHCVPGYGGEGVIRGSLGYYKIVKSGIIFIPRNNLSEFPDNSLPTDILPFKAEDSCNKDVEFVVVFTYSRCVDCEGGCNKSCKC